jgi:tRNA pseudouridine38-40 synthase
MTAASRTDAGVHAVGQVVNFSSETTIPIERLCDAANSVLPDDIVVWEAAEAPAEFHARFWARGKRYRYAIWNAPTCPPGLRRYVWHLARPLDVEAMRSAAACLVGRHDYASFALSGSETGSTVRQLWRLVCFPRGRLVLVTLEGNGFLRGMCRGIVGTLVEIGRGKECPEFARRALQARDRSAAGPTAPAAGLCLMQVKYHSTPPVRGGHV